MVPVAEKVLAPASRVAPTALLAVRIAALLLRAPSSEERARTVAAPAGIAAHAPADPPDNRWAKCRLALRGARSHDFHRPTCARCRAEDYGKPELHFPSGPSEALSA